MDIDITFFQVIDRFSASHAENGAKSVKDLPDGSVTNKSNACNRPVKVFVNRGVVRGYGGGPGCNARQLGGPIRHPREVVLGFGYISDSTSYICDSIWALAIASSALVMNC